MLLPETAAVVDLSINQTSLDEVDRLVTHRTYQPLPCVGHTSLSTGLKISQALKGEKKLATEMTEHEKTGGVCECINDCGLVPCGVSGCREFDSL